MSFTDLGVNKNNGTLPRQTNSSSISKNTPSQSQNLDSIVVEIGESLTKFQSNCNLVKSKLENSSKTPMTVSTKTEIDGIMKGLKDQLKQVKDKLDNYVKQVNNLPREEGASRRVSVVKLQRDYERVSTQFQNIQKDHTTLRVDRTTQGNSSPDNFSNAYDNSQNGTPQYQQYQQQQQQQQIMHELVDVDDAIIEERERDIKKINQELLLVNEMFRDMAEIVEKQGGTIKKIEQDSEVSKDRAREGLEEVKQAAQYQPTCVIN